MTSSNSPSTDQVTLVGRGDLAIANLTPLGQSKLANLSLDRDDKGAIVLNDANLKKLSQIGLLNFEQDQGTYTLNLSLAAISDINQGAFVPAADGIWRLSPESLATSQQVQVRSALPSGAETTISGALQMQLGAPSSEVQNPYLGGQSAKLMIVMRELLTIQREMALFDKDASLRTFSRAIDNVQSLVGAIKEKIDAQNQRLMGDIAAAQLSIYSSASSLLLQASALGALGILRAGANARQRPEANSGQTGEAAGDALKSRITLRQEEAQANSEHRPAPASSSASSLTLTPESGGGKSPVDARPSAAANAPRSKWSAFAEFNLEKNLLGAGAPLAQLFDSTFQKYIDIEHSQQNIASNQNVARAEGAQANAELQALLIKRQMETDRAQGDQNNDRVQQLLDLILALSRSSSDNQRTLFQG